MTRRPLATDRCAHLSIFAALAWSAALLAGCGPGAANGGRGTTPNQERFQVTDESYHELRRRYLRMDPEAPTRRALRDALIAHLAEGSAARVTAGDYDEAVAHLARMTLLLTPRDIEAGEIPESLFPLARFVVERGSPPGDEGRVMGALLLLAAGEGSDGEHRRRRQEIADWGREARSNVQNPLHRYGGMIEVWERHEELAPHPEVLGSLARAYLEQREALVGLLNPEQGFEPPPGLSLRQMSMVPLLIRRAPLDLASVYLRHGDLSAAVAAVEAMSDDTGGRFQVLRVLRAAAGDGDEAPDALAALAQSFERGRPRVARGICRLGLRRHPRDPRFPICLAHVATGSRELAEATAWYEEAVGLAPEDQEVYDEAITRLAEILESGALEEDISQMRSTAHHAAQIIDERQRRWPSSPPAVSLARLFTAVGAAEMQAGHAAEATAALERSIGAEESVPALILLGEVQERLGQGEQAAARYRQALDRSTQEAQRAELLAHLGDAFRVQGRTDQAHRMYRQALSNLDSLGNLDIPGPVRALITLRQGVMLSRIGERAQATEAFRAAMEQGPGNPRVYATILAHLMIAPPQVELAHEVFRRALFQTTLAPEWKVYYALWVRSIAGRAGQPPEEDVEALLRDFSRTDQWYSQLANFGRGELDYTRLLAAAQSRGHRAEAHFYEGTRLLAAGDREGARRLFEQVLAAGMIRFFEHQMAQELLSGE